MERTWEMLQNQIMELKYFCHFDLFEIATMTNEDRKFYLQWIIDQKKRENSKTEDLSFGN